MGDPDTMTNSSNGPCAGPLQCWWPLCRPHGARAWAGPIGKGPCAGPLQCWGPCARPISSYQGDLRAPSEFLRSRDIAVTVREGERKRKRQNASRKTQAPTALSERFCVNRRHICTALAAMSPASQRELQRGSQMNGSRCNCFP